MKKVLNIAHRGLSSKFAENSLRAIDEALKAGADGYECDLRLTADGKIVLFHDDDLKRLCGRAGSIETMTWSEIQTLKVNGSEKIPLLEDVLSTFQPEAVNLEIKASSRDSVVTESVLRELTKIRPQGRILISSFSTEVLRSLNAMDPQRKMGQVGLLVETAEIKNLPQLSNELRPNTWNAPRQILQGPWPSRWINEEIKPLWIWTLDEPDQWRSALESKLPVEALITNKADALSQFLSCFTPDPSRD